jgi:hypothetical protein
MSGDNGVSVPGAGVAPGVVAPGQFPGAHGVPGQAEPGAGAPAGVVPGAVAPAPGAVNDPAAAGAGAPATAANGARPGLAARLSKIEYANSVFDVLGVALLAEELDDGAGGIPDDGGDGVFKHFADKQTSVEQHPLAYFHTAKGISERVDMDALVMQYSACTEPLDSCGAVMIRGLGQRFFRRPLDEREVGVFSVLQLAAAEAGSDFAGSMRAVVHAMLQSPQFLFRLQDETTGTAGQDRPLSGVEVGARLASFLWVSVPDSALLDAAAAGGLADPVQLQAQVTRMLADPKAQRFTETFITDFSRARLAAFEGVTEADRVALHDSVVATFQYHLWEAGSSIADLFTTTEYLVNPIVADLLGAQTSGSPLAGSDLELLDVSGLPERVGLLAHPGMIAGMGDREIGSFVNRGKYLMERLLCRNPISLPPELQGELEDFAADNSGLNEHEKAALRMQRAECWGCHAQFEPFAFGFSRFDGAGRYIGEVDAEGRPLPLDGWIPTSTEANSPHYTNVADYMQVLATDPTIQTCMTEHFLNFATAHGTDALAKTHVKTIGATYLAGGSTLQAMVAAVVSNPLFNQIQVVSPDGATLPAGN